MIRKTFFFSLALVLASAPGFAQPPGHAATQSGTAAVTASASAPAIPKDPKDLMLLAAKVNGLGSIVAQPWHVKANFETFDADGKPKDKGIFEEWWAGPKKWKISYTSNGFSQTEYVNGDQDVITGDVGWVPLPEELVEKYLTDPVLLEVEPNKKDRFSIHKRKLAGVRVNCIEPESRQRFGTVRFCFEPNPVIRLEYAPDGMFVAFNNVIRAGDHYLAREVIIGNAGHTIAKADVAQLEIPAKFEDSQFAPPVGQVTSVPGQRVKGDFLGTSKIGGDDPEYPDWAMRHRTGGTVIVQFTITKLGTVDDAQVISGPKELRQSVLEAVKTWKYKPYLLNGRPINVRAHISATFMLR